MQNRAPPHHARRRGGHSRPRRPAGVHPTDRGPRLRRRRRPPRPLAAPARGDRVRRVAPRPRAVARRAQRDQPGRLLRGPGAALRRRSCGRVWQHHRRDGDGDGRMRVHDPDDAFATAGRYVRVLRRLIRSEPPAARARRLQRRARAPCVATAACRPTRRRSATCGPACARTRRWPAFARVWARRPAPRGGSRAAPRSRRGPSGPSGACRRSPSSSTASG